MKNIVRVFGIIAILGSLLAYQNCSEVELSKRKEASLVAPFSMKANFCANGVVSFGVVNLTSVIKDGVLLPDSDADGLPDEVEDVLPDFNPVDRRSSDNILDGPCRLLGDATTCQQNACNGVNNNHFGLTQCDLNAFNILGLDHDEDLLPDIVEVLKGTQPGFADALQNVDLDQLNNRDEVHKGRDPLVPDDDWPEHLQVHTSFSSIGQCSNLFARNTLEVDYVPLVETRAFTQPGENMPSGISLAHGAGENLILVYYIVDTGNGKKYFGSYLKVDQQSGAVELTDADFTEFLTL